MNIRSLRIGVVGARRHVQGIGQYLAGHLAACGAEVRGIVGTSPATIETAQRTLKSQYGLQVRGYHDLAQMIEAERLEAVAICSPYRFHPTHLQTALALRQHVLCEKPLVFQSDRDNVADARQWVADFQRAGRVLMVNLQWPYTLPAFDRCYPNLRRERLVQRLEMLLAPVQDGIRMIPDAVPHVASLMLALAPEEGQVKNIQCTPAKPGRLDFTWQYAHAQGVLDVRICLVQVPQQPRPAAYAINDCTAMRRIDLPTYQMYLQPVGPRPSDLAGQPEPNDPIGPQALPLEDPLRLLAADFISRVRTGRNSTQENARLVQNVRIVQAIYQAAERVLSPR
ncbi:MAG: Gfo/Idh/MocA family oxidoreductase [Planctomycetales bacterium]|nr:Gfo/Idh/MocA family oxidoreductase [Planctomycetales bacterium]NIM10123.1 Gfo/Idh/MocA family oxidoreductase [Planctomycetales bacterium]NIN09565.1 Gfo/Idh/MocA family oxidoreductase [Planctomycetales bacterium]NIN78677.1 Gfo/Idh/MocA family oxidoreductase [Planctomycetales bacterium]NIO35866.1 Gfo/Idh/MocA family oxidoreductase [Planctomycetales bacterium]